MPESKTLSKQRQDRRGVLVRSAPLLRPIRIFFPTLMATLLAGISIIGASIGATAAPSNWSPPLASLGQVTGTVRAVAPFGIARVFLKNIDRNIGYVVFTRSGVFHAVALFPGRYDVHAQTSGFESPPERLVITAGGLRNVVLTMHASNIEKLPVISGLMVDPYKPPESPADYQPYATIYPPGPGRDILERTCMTCHGEDLIPSLPPGGEAVWNVWIDKMMGKNLAVRSAATYAEGILNYRDPQFQFSLEDRATLVSYLASNFGPTARHRAVRIDQPAALDEEALSKAEFIEYYLPEDPPGQGTRSTEFADESSLAGGFYSRYRWGQDVRFDAEGNVWLTDRGIPERLVKLDPRTGQQKSYLFPDPRGGNHEVIVDRFGMIWCPQHRGLKPSAEKLLLGFNPKTEKWEHQIPMDPHHILRNENNWLQSIAFDSRDNAYVGWIMGGALSRWDRATNAVEIFPVPEQTAIVYGTVADRNDNIWMALWNSGQIAKFDTTTHGWTLYVPPTHPGQVRRPNVDADNNIWFGIWSAGPRAAKLVMLDQTTGRMKEWDIPQQNAHPYDVESDPDGNIWSVDDGGSAATIWKFDRKTQHFTFYPKPEREADSAKIQVTREGAIWYSPRASKDWPGFGVLYPDMNKIQTLGAFYTNGPPGYPFVSVKAIR